MPFHDLISTDASIIERGLCKDYPVLNYSMFEITSSGGQKDMRVLSFCFVLFCFPSY